MAYNINRSINNLGINQIFFIFERRYRAQNALSENIAGSGLGLYIVKQIVLAHGGRIWAENVETGGLAIVLELPINA